MQADERTEQEEPTTPRETEGSDPSVSSQPQDGPAEAPADASGETGGSDPSVSATPATEDEEEPDYKDLYLRAVAESDNVRKRARRDVEVAQTRGVARLARELLPALDNLDRAIAAAEADADGDGEHHLTKGIRLVQQELLGAMARVGIEPYSPQGEAFDPHHHEAVAQQPVEGQESGTIVTVYQAGYRYGDEVLRAAKVVVAA